MRTLVRTVGWMGLVCVMTIVAVVGGVYVTHPRDETAYLKYVEKYGQHQRNPSSDRLIEAGNEACAWLSHRPPALWRAGEGYRVGDLADAYRNSAKDGDSALLQTIVPGAWKYLCPATELLVKPHYVFSDPHSD